MGLVTIDFNTLLSLLWQK